MQIPVLFDVFSCPPRLSIHHNPPISEPDHLSCGCTEELRGQVEAIFEAKLGHGECHDGGGGTWLERQSFLDWTWLNEGFVGIWEEL